jgi:RHS repeat-associated protein
VAPTAGANTNRTAVTDNGGTPSPTATTRPTNLSSSSDASVGTPTYDPHGNTVTMGAQTLTYDGSDRHVATTTGSTSVSYLRDATDRIIARTEGGATVRYHHAGPGDSASYTTTDGLDLIPQDRTIGLMGGVTLTKRGTGDVWSYPNIHGDVVATADPAGAKRGGTLSYDPFGVALTPSSTTAPDGVPDNSAGNLDYGWLGQHQRGLEHAAGIATIEMGARPYVPGLGRFLRVDPVEGGSCNGYDYVCGDPVNRFDLDGLCESAEKWCVIGILEGSESLPEGFVEWGTRRRGSAYAVIGNQSRRWLMHGACGGPQGDTGRTFNFRRACQTHDLGYDLMRYFRSSGTRGSTRRAVDALFGRDLVSHCRTRSRFDRPFCYTAADAIHTGVDIGSVGERYGVPK